MVTRFTAKASPLLVAMLLALAFALVFVAGAIAQPADEPSAPWTLTLKWQRCPAWYCETGWYASPAVADLDKDDIAEVYWGGYTLMAVDGPSGAIKWIGLRGSSERLWPGIVAADLDQNGTQEIVTGSGDGMLSVYGPGLTPEPHWPLNPTGTTNEIRSLAVGDLDHNGDLEIALCSTRSDNQWFVYEHTGALRGGWPKMTDGNSSGYAAGCFNENVGIADLDGDGSGEIIGPNDTHYIAAFHPDGSALAANLVYGMVDGHAKPWARVGLHVDNAVDLRGYANCGEEHRPNMANSAPTLADVDGDGNVEVIVVGNVYNCGTDPYSDLYEMPFILNPDRTRWKNAAYDWTAIPTPDAHAGPLSEDYTVIENNVPNPVVVDLDGDGQREILYPSYDGRLHAYWLDQQEHGNWPLAITVPGEGFIRFATEPAVADLDNDGKAEVIFASWTQNESGRAGKLSIASWDGKLLQSVDLPFAAEDGRGGALSAPTLANIDQDPDLEVMVGTINKGLVAYDLSASANARILWRTGRGGYLRSGTPPATGEQPGALDASTKNVSNGLPQPGAVVTYTIRLKNSGALLPAVNVTDTLPSNAALNVQSLNATSGELHASSATITWTGAVSSSSDVAITYAMTVSAVITQPTTLINLVQIDDGNGKTLTRTAAAIVGGKAVYLPAVR